MAERINIDAVNLLAKAFLPAGRSVDAANLYVSDNANTVLNDLTKIKGKQYSNMNDPATIEQVANDAFEWNKFLLQKKYSIDTDKYDQNTLFVLTTIYGHRGALRYLNEPEKMPAKAKAAIDALNNILPAQPAVQQFSQAEPVASVTPIAAIAETAAPKTEVEQKAPEVITTSSDVWKTLDLKEVQVVGKMGNSQYSFEEAREIVDKKWQQQLEKNPYPTGKEKNKFLEAEYKELGVREHVSLRKVENGDKKIEDFLVTAKDMNLDDLFNFFEPLSRLVFIRRSQDDADKAVRLFPAAITEGEQRNFSLEEKLLIAQFVTSNGDAAADFFNDKAALNIDTANAYSFTPTSQALEKITPYLSASENKKLESVMAEGGKFTVPFKDNYDTESLQAWQEKLFSTYPAEAGIRFFYEEVVTKVAEVENAYRDNGLYSIDKFGRNFSLANGVYAAGDTTENISKYKDYYASKMLPEKGGDALKAAAFHRYQNTPETAAEVNRLDDTYKQNISEVAGLRKAIGKIQATSDEQNIAVKLLQLLCERELAQLRFKRNLLESGSAEEDKDLLLNLNSKENRLDIQMFDKGAFKALGAVNQLISSQPPQLREKLEQLIARNNAEEKFNNREIVAGGESAREYIQRENLGAAVPPATFDPKRPDTKLGFESVNTLKGENTLRETGVESRPTQYIGFNLTAHKVMYPLKTNSLYTEAKFNDVRAGVALNDSDIVAIAPLSAGKDFLQKQKGEVSLNYRPQRFSEYSLKFSGQVNGFTHGHEVSLGHNWHNVSESRTFVGAVGRRQSFYRSDLTSYGMQAFREVKLLSTGDYSLINIGVEGGVADMRFEKESIENKLNKLYIEPKASYSFVNYPVIFNAYASVKMFDVTGEGRNVTLAGISYKRPNWNTEASVLTTNNLRVYDMSAGVEYKLAGVEAATKLQASMVELNSTINPPAISLQQLVSLGKGIELDVGGAVNLGNNLSNDNRNFTLPNNVKIGVRKTF